MKPSNDQRLSRGIPYLLAVLLLITLLTLPSGEAKESGESVILLGGSFEHPPIHAFLQGSKRTLLYPAMVGTNGELTPLEGSPWMTTSEWDLLVKRSRKSSALLLSTLDPLLIRDRKGVLQMAVLTTDSPLVASCILTPGFLTRFSALFGPEVIVAIPARNKIYVFPKLANRLPDMTQNIRDDYLISAMPVSTELLEISKKGIKAVGNIDPSDR